MSERLNRSVEIFKQAGKLAVDMAVKFVSPREIIDDLKNYIWPGFYGV